MLPSANLLRAVRFESPESIPIGMSVSGACWRYYPQEALKELLATHPLLFPGYETPKGEVVPKEAPWRRAGVAYTDSWGCTWETLEDGITGAVTKHRLASWDDFETFEPPAPAQHNGWGPVDWEAIAQATQKTLDRGGLARGSLRHGHTFLTLTYLRGYENLLFDMVDEEPRLWALIEQVEAFNAELVRRYLALGVGWMGYPEDLGMQVGPMLSPAHFRKYLKPTYQRLMAAAREAGCVIHMHSDGDLRALLPDLLDCGIDALNLQDLVNGIDWIATNLKGRVCIDLDLDRQNVTRFGTPAQIDALVREAVEKLGSKRGGLMLHHGLFPGPPLENIRALMDAMERYAGHDTG